MTRLLRRYQSVPVCVHSSWPTVLPATVSIVSSCLPIHYGYNNKDRPFRQLLFSSASHVSVTVHGDQLYTVLTLFSFKQRSTNLFYFTSSFSSRSTVCVRTKWTSNLNAILNRERSTCNVPSLHRCTLPENKISRRFSSRGQDGTLYESMCTEVQGNLYLEEGD